MKKIILCLLLFNLSLFSQNYIEKLYEAIEDDDIEEIKKIVNIYDVDINNTFLVKEQSAMGATFEGEYLKLTPLNFAIECNNLEAVSTIIKLGANIEYKTECKGYYGSYSFTPLMYCVNSYESTEKIVSLLIQNGVNINTKNRYGTTALMYAAYSHDSKCVDLLIKNKADINIKDKNKRNALIYSCMNSDWGLYGSLNPDVLKSLINAGANINEIDEEGNTALLYAIDVYNEAFGWYDDENDDYLVDALADTYKAIKLLIDNGSNVNIKNKNGETSLSSGKLTELLIDSGAY